MTLIAYAYAAAAELVLFIRERELFTWAKLARDSVIAGLAFAYSVWAIWGSGEEWLAKGFMLLLFGIPVYVWMKWRQEADAGQRRSRTSTERSCAASTCRRRSPPPSGAPRSASSEPPTRGPGTGRGLS